MFRELGTGREWMNKLWHIHAIGTTATRASVSSSLKETEVTSQGSFAKIPGSNVLTPVSGT